MLASRMGFWPVSEGWIKKTTILLGRAHKTQFSRHPSQPHLLVLVGLPQPPSAASIDRGSTIDPHRNLYRNCCFPRSTLLLLLTMQNLLYFPPAPGKVNLSPAVYSRLGFSSSVPHAAAAAAALNHHQQLQIKSSHQLDLDRLNLP